MGNNQIRTKCVGIINERLKEKCKTIIPTMKFNSNKHGFYDRVSIEFLTLSRGRFDKYCLDYTEIKGDSLSERSEQMKSVFSEFKKLWNQLQIEFKEIASYEDIIECVKHFESYNYQSEDSDLKIILKKDFSEIQIDDIDALYRASKIYRAKQRQLTEPEFNFEDSIMLDVEYRWNSLEKEFFFRHKERGYNALQALCALRNQGLSFSKNVKKTFDNHVAFMEEHIFDILSETTSVSKVILLECHYSDKLINVKVNDTLSVKAFNRVTKNWDNKENRFIAKVDTDIIVFVQANEDGVHVIHEERYHNACIDVIGGYWRNHKTTIVADGVSETTYVSSAGYEYNAKLFSENDCKRAFHLSTLNAPIVRKITHDDGRKFFTYINPSSLEPKNEYRDLFLRTVENIWLYDYYQSEAQLIFGAFCPYDDDWVNIIKKLMDSKHCFLFDGFLTYKGYPGSDFDYEKDSLDYAWNFEYNKEKDEVNASFELRNFFKYFVKTPNENICIRAKITKKSIEYFSYDGKPITREAAESMSTSIYLFYEEDEKFEGMK